jgi:hypothetical protein
MVRASQRNDAAKLGSLMAEEQADMHGHSHKQLGPEKKDDSNKPLQDMHGHTHKQLGPEKKDDSNKPLKAHRKQATSALPVVY